MLLSERTALYAEQRRLEQAAVDDVVTLARRRFPKRKIGDFAKAWKLVSERPEVTVIQQVARERIEVMREKLVTTAAEIDRLCEFAEIRSSDRWLSADVVHSGDWHTQGFGAARYALSSAQIKVLASQAIGVDAVIWTEQRPSTSTRWSTDIGPNVTHVVAVRVDDEVDLQILKRRPALTLRDQVKWCLKLGVNPRVYMPMLTHDFEARHKLDYFGNDVG